MAITYIFDQHLPYTAFLTSRSGGCSLHPYSSFNLGTHVGDDMQMVKGNRTTLAGEVGLDAERFVYMEQVHGNHVVVVDDVPSVVPVCDALVTSTPDLALMVLVADCVPLVFVSENPRVVAVAHAGWRGTAQRVAAKTVQTMMEKFGADPSRIIVAMGPSIGPCCYAVGDEVVAAVLAQIPDGAQCLTRIADKVHLDLHEANAKVLMDVGILHENIHRKYECSACDSDVYYSYRAEGGRTGRFGMGVFIREGQSLLMKKNENPLT